MSSGWWILIAIVVGAWLLWSKPKINRTTPKPVPQFRTSDPEVKRELADVEAAKVARDELQQQANAALKQHLKDQEVVQKKIARARDYMKQTGLDHAIPSLWNMVENWPHWVKLPDRWTPPEGVTNINGGGEHKDSTTAWEWDEHRYSMHFTETTIYLPDEITSSGDIELEVDDKPACAISCSRGSESWETWRYSDVNSLSVGPWMADLIKMEGRLRDARERSTRETFAKFERDKADRLHFGE